MTATNMRKFRWFRCSLVGKFSLDGGCGNLLVIKKKKEKSNNSTQKIEQF